MDILLLYNMWTTIRLLVLTNQARILQ